MKITLKQFKKFANDNDILWFYNKPRWRVIPGARMSRKHYTKDLVDEFRKFQEEMFLDNSFNDALPYIKFEDGKIVKSKLAQSTDKHFWTAGNWLYAIFGTPEEREIERINLLNKKKELQMDEQKDGKEQKHARIGNLTDALENAMDDLEKLVNRVNGEPVNVTKKAEEENKTVGVGSLVLFLDEYPKRIETLHDRITVATNQLTGLLF